MSARSFSAVLLAACLLLASFAEASKDRKGARNKTNKSEVISKTASTTTTTTTNKKTSVPTATTSTTNTRATTTTTSTNTLARTATTTTTTSASRKDVAAALDDATKMLAQRDALQGLENSPEYMDFVNSAGYIKTGNLLTRLAVVEKLNQLIYSGLKENKELTDEDSIYLEVYGSTRCLCALDSSDMDVIALYSLSSPSRLFSLMPKVNEIISSKSSASITVEDDLSSKAVKDTLTKRAVSRFNSFVGVNKLRGEMEPVRASFRITKHSFQKDFGLIKITLEITSNYCDPFTLSMDINAHEASFNDVDLSSLAFIPWDKQMEVFNKISGSVPKIRGLFNLTNIYEKIVDTGCSIPTYLHLVRVVKKWAESQRIYNTLAGYLSSTTIMVTCARFVMKHKEAEGVMTLDALVPGYFKFMLDAHKAVLPPFVSIFLLSPKENKEVSCHPFNKIHSFCPLVIYPAPIISASQAAVNTKTSRSSKMLITMMLARAVETMHMNDGLPFKLNKFCEAITNDGQAKYFREYLTKNFMKEFSCTDLIVSLDSNKPEAERSMDKVNFFLMSKRVDEDSDSFNKLFVLVNTDVDADTLKYKFHVFTKSPVQENSMACIIQKLVKEQKFTACSFSSSKSEFNSALAPYFSSSGSNRSGYPLSMNSVLIASSRDDYLIARQQALLAYEQSKKKQHEEELFRRQYFMQQNLKQQQRNSKQQESSDFDIDD